MENKFTNFLRIIIGLVFLGTLGLSVLCLLLLPVLIALKLIL